MKRALLVLAEMPSGFQVEPGNGGDDTLRSSSKSSKCSALVALTNEARPPGSKASGDITFSGGSNGPFLSESLDAMGSPGAASHFVAGYHSAVSACRTLTLRIKGVSGSSPVRVSPVAPPHLGDSAYAARYAATSGALAGFELTVVTIQAGDVLLTLLFDGALPEDIDGFSSTAMDKVQKVLSVSGSTGT